MANVFSKAIPIDVFVSPQKVSISLTVRNQSGVPLGRTVFVFYSANMALPVEIGESDPTTGQATFLLNGTPLTEFAFLVRGERGENHAVHSHKKAT